MLKNEQIYHVALSFAGEDRAFVEKVSEYLKSHNLNVFYDIDEEISLWGTDLGDKLDEVYRERSQYVVMFISKHYASKMWTNHERKSVLARALKENREYLLPARFDDTELPGLRPTMAYIDLRKETPETFAAKIVKKVDRIESTFRQRITPLSLESAEIKILIPKRAILLAEAVYHYLPAGSFPMGSDDGYPHEKPLHSVRVSSFYMAATLVTNHQFAEFTHQTNYTTIAEKRGSGLCLVDGVWQLLPDANWRHPQGSGSSLSGKENHPVVQVSWIDAKEYCNWLLNRTNFHFDLPTEAQWEYAAAGPRGLRWPFGDTYQKELANLEGNDTTPVGSFPPNDFGLYDMTGNVGEWCVDWYAQSWMEAGHRLDHGEVLDPSGPAAGEARVLRGGSWFDGAKHSRNANRFSAEPSLSAANWGFRCCLLLTDALLIKLLGTAQWGMSSQQMLIRE